MKYTSTAFALAALTIPVARAQGTAAIVNMCEFPVYTWSVSNVQSMMVALPNQTVGYQESYRNKPDGSGISIKLAPSFVGQGDIDFSKNVTQFEYTLTSGTKQVWYDISYVNGNAFQGTPVLLQPSDLSCQNVTCAAGDSVCKEMYNNPNDNLATHVCGSDADLFFLLCPPNGDGSSSSSSSSGNTAAAAVTGNNNGDATEVVNVGANGEVQETEETASAGHSSKVITQPALSNLTSLDAFSNTVSSWLTFSNPPSKRDEELSTRHSHKEFHEHARRSRIFRHSHS